MSQASSSRTQRTQVSGSRGRPPPPSRRASKAVYRPLVSSQGRWSQVRRFLAGAHTLTGSQGLSALSEGEETSTQYTFASAPPRTRPVPSSPRATVTIATIAQYLTHTGVEDTFCRLLHKLLGLTDLPYNPYPGFSRRLRLHAERFHMFSKTDDEVLKLLSCAVETSHLAYLFSPVGCDFVYGLETIVSVVEPRVLRGYCWLVQSLCGGLEKTHGYTNQVMLSVSGPAAVHGSLCVAPTAITVHYEYLITGPDATKGVELYINNILTDIFLTEQDSQHILLGVLVPKPDPFRAGHWTDNYWDYDTMASRKNEFRKSVIAAITGSQVIYADCVFCMDAERTGYRKGRKVYGLNFLQVTEEGEQTGLSYFTSLPLSSLYEGVFLIQSHAEAYLSTFTNKPNLLDKKAQHTKESARRTPWSRAPRPQPRPSPAPGGKVQIDGFLISERPGHSPEAEDTKVPIRTRWQRYVATLDTHTEIFELVYKLLFLVLMDRASYPDSLLVEIQRFLRGTAARLHILMQLNKTIRELIHKWEGQESSAIVDGLFIEYKTGLIQLFNSDLQERSSDLVTCSAAIDDVLTRLLQGEDRVLADCVPLERKTMDTLKSLNSYCYTLLVGLVEDGLDHCPLLKKLIVNVKKAFPDDVPRPQTGVRDRVHKKKTGVLAGAGEENFVHGLEEEAILKHDRQVINIEMCIERDTAPKMVAVEAVLLRYLTDTHLDEMWSDYLLDLVTGPTLPPNPYPRLVSACRQNAMRMDLCYESPATLTARLQQTSARPEEPDYYVYHIPGCDAHGLQTALSMLDTGTFFQLAPLAEQFIQEEFKMRKGPYRIAVCCAVSGFTPLYGYMDPYLNDIELHEHCYIRGPEGCWGEALQIYSKIVYDHIKVLYNKRTHFMAYLYMGRHGNETRWTIEELLNRKKGYAADFERYCDMREPIYLKMFVQMDWRLVPVTKYFKYHYINDAETERETLFPDNPAHLYQNIFLNKERAAFHFEYGGPPDSSDPYNASSLRRVGRAINAEVVDAAERQDWVNVYRWLLLKANINKGQSVLAEAWRMFHSVARTLEYTLAQLYALQDLVRYAVTLGQRIAADDTYYNVTTQDDDSDILHTLDMTLGQMALALRQKVTVTLTSQVAMAPRMMVDVVTAKLQAVTERDQVTREMFVVLEQKTIFVLEEVINMIRALKDATSRDVHATCHESHAMLRSMEAELRETRPQTGQSQRSADKMAANHRVSQNWADF